MRRADKGGVLHAGIGKVSFAVEKLRENLAMLASAVVAARPKRAKGANFGGYVQKARRTPCAKNLPSAPTPKVACTVRACVLASAVVAAWPPAVLQHGKREVMVTHLGGCMRHTPGLCTCMTPVRTRVALIALCVQAVLLSSRCDIFYLYISGRAGDSVIKNRPWLGTSGGARLQRSGI